MLRLTDDRRYVGFFFIIQIVLNKILKIFSKHFCVREKIDHRLLRSNNIKHRFE